MVASPLFLGQCGNGLLWTEGGSLPGFVSSVAKGVTAMGRGNKGAIMHALPCLLPHFVQDTPEVNYFPRAATRRLSPSGVNSSGSKAGSRWTLRK